MLSNKMPTSFVPTEYTEPKMDVPTTNPEPRITPHTPRKVEKNVPPLFFEKARGGGGQQSKTHMVHVDRIQMLGFDANRALTYAQGI